MSNKPLPLEPNEGFTDDSQQEIQQKNPEKDREFQKCGWRPRYLQRRVLFAFTVAFCAVIAALEVLNHISQVNYGIASSVNSRHYAWTYSPTAILTVVAALWSRVEFQAKQYAPWQAMQEEPTEASQSVLLDYISPMQPVALFKAFKNRHLVVFSAISCSLLLSLAIVLSTGLFALREVQFQRNGVEIQLLDTFVWGNISSATQGNPFDILDEILFTNGSYPDGTTKDVAFQRFSASNLSSDAILSVPVEAMMTGLTCESAELQLQPGQYRQTGPVTTQVDNYQQVTIITPSCKRSNLSIEDSAIVEPHYLADMRYINCDGTTGEDGERILVIAAQIHEASNQNRPLGNPTYYTKNMTVDRSVQLMCKPFYSLINVNVTRNASESLSNVQLVRIGSNSSTLSGLNSWDVAEASLQSAYYPGFDRLVKSNTPFHSVDAYSLDEVTSQIQIGAWLAGVAGEIGILFQDGELEKITTAYFRAMGAQIMHNALAKPYNTTALGSALVKENRVVMTQLPLRVIESCLILGMLFALLIIMQNTRRQPVKALWNPASIYGIASMLSNSRALTQSLIGTSAATLDVLQARLATTRYFCHITDGNLSISAMAKDEPGIPTAQGKISSTKTTVPFPNIICRIAIFLACVLIAVALEVVLHISQANNGLGDVNNDDYVHYLWTVVPSLVMVTIGLAFGSIDFNTRTLAPYGQLRRLNGATFDQFMTIDFQNSLTTTIMVNSIRTKHFAVLVTTCAAILTSFLTIVSSGLWSPLEVPQKVTTNVTREDTFDRYILNKNISTIDYDTMPDLLVARFILRDKIPYPRWTYEELAFPKLSFNNTTTFNASAGSYIDIWVPALRGAPVCQLQTGSQVNFTFHDLESSADPMKRALRITAPRIRCNPYSDYQFINPGTTQDVLIPRKGDGTFGSASMLMCSVADESKLDLERAHSVMSYVWGHTENGAVQHIASLVCAAAAQVVNTWTRFQLPHFDIPDEYPPKPDESSATSAVNQFVPVANFMSTSADGTNSTSMDPFFETLTVGRYAIPEESLRNPNDVDKVVKAIKFQSNIMTAQGLNYTRIVNTRHNVSYAGDVIFPNRLRLFQDAVSTRVLEALLASIVILGILGSILMNTDHILPKSPSSIAAIASLLAESNFLGWIQNVEKDSNDNAIGRQFFARYRFFIGRSSDSSDEKSSSSEVSKIPDDYTIHIADPANKNGVFDTEIVGTLDFETRSLIGSRERPGWV